VERRREPRRPGANDNHAPDVLLRVLCLALCLACRSTLGRRRRRAALAPGGRRTALCEESHD
jgi:hypothetical protein